MSDARNRDVALAAPATARLPVDVPVSDALSSLREVGVREVVPSDYVVVVRGVAPGVKDGFHALAPPTPRVTGAKRLKGKR